jgi:drug/metabolite transporter (DMT)-like permease
MRFPWSAVAPYGYTELIWATCIGYFIFGDLPDLWAWLGMAIICASGIYISMRELRLAAARPKS